MARFAPTRTIKPEEIQVGGSIEIHAESLATFKTYVSRANKQREVMKIRFHYAEFIGSFCKATRLEDEDITLPKTLNPPSSKPTTD